VPDPLDVDAAMPAIAAAATDRFWSSCTARFPVTVGDRLSPDRNRRADGGRMSLAPH